MWPVRKRIERVIGIDSESYEFPIFVKVDKDVHNKFKHIKKAKYVWNDPKTKEDILFGDVEFERGKRVILENLYTEECRIATVYAYSKNMPPVFDNSETLIEYNVIASEISL